MGARRATCCTSTPEACKIGRVPATTMMAKTNRGSVKLRESKYSSVGFLPSMRNMLAAKTIAQKPKTTSTSPSKCQMPACFGRVLAKCSKNLALNVCNTARAKVLRTPKAGKDGPLKASLFRYTAKSEAARPSQNLLPKIDSTLNNSNLEIYCLHH